VAFFEIIEKARNRPERVRYALAAVLTCLIMAVIVSMWLIFSFAVSRNELSSSDRDNYSRGLITLVKDFFK